MRLLRTVLFLLSVICAATIAVDARGASVIVAAADSSDLSKSRADMVCTGEGDQEVINAAIRSLPEAGGTVLLMEGNYDIRKVEGKLGGVLVERSHVTLAGQGPATRLTQAPNQNTNVIRIIGSGVGHVTIRDLYVDANRDENPNADGDPNVSHARFEFCGIKAFYTEPGGPTGQTLHHVTVMNCHVMDAARLGIMLEGNQMRVLNNVIGNAHSDAVEILTGPGEIRGNFMEITGRTHVAIGTDRAESMVITDNIVHIKETGDADIGIRIWAGYRRHVVANNVITVESGGRLGTAMDIRGTGAVVTNNYVSGADPENRLPLWITGGNTIFTTNVVDNVELVINDKTDLNRPILVRDNIYENSVLRHVKGNLVTDVVAPLAPE
jgi:hypothetical protein